MDHLEVLLRQGYVRFPGREQLSVSSPGDHQAGDNRNKLLDGQRHFFPFTTGHNGRERNARGRLLNEAR